VVTRTTSTGVPGDAAGPVQLKEMVAEPLGVMVVVDDVDDVDDDDDDDDDDEEVVDDEYVMLLVLHIIVPLVNSSSPRVIEVEGLSGGL